jgi:hypothetical protein
VKSIKKPSVIYILGLLLLLLGIGGFISGAALMLAPDGSLMSMPLSVMDGSPFTNFFIPGLILYVFIGVYPLGIAFGIAKQPTWNWPNAINPFKQYHWSWAGSLAAGVIVLIWLSVELLWVPFSTLHEIYYIWAGVILLLTLLPQTRKYLKIK